MFPFHYHEGDGQYGRPQATPAGWETFQTAGPAGKYSINQPMPQEPSGLQASPYGFWFFNSSIQLLSPPPPCGVDGADPPPPPPRLPEGR